MESSIIFVFHIGKTLIPCLRMLRVVHAMVESMAEGGSHWVWGAIQGMGRYCAQNNCPPQHWWWCKSRIKVLKSYDGLQWGAPTNVTKIFHPPETYGHPILIMSLFVFSIGFLHDVMILLADVLNVTNKPSGFISFGLNMGRFFPCSCKRQCNIKGT